MAPILLTGGTGKIATRIAPLLLDTGHSVILASRKAPASALPNCTTMRFDWDDERTHESVLALQPRAIFLVAPPVMRCVRLMKGFVDRAVREGAKRLVLLSGSVKGKGDGVLLDEIAEWIKRRAVEWVVLRPSWFMEDFSETHHRDSIRDLGEIITATGTGKIPFVAAADVAAVAVKALTEDGMAGRELLVLGSELLSFDDIATHLTHLLRRPITHISISEDEMALSMEQSGLEPEFARLLAQLDAVVRNGGEERGGGDMEGLLGRKGVRFGEWLEGVGKGVWDSK